MWSLLLMVRAALGETPTEYVGVNQFRTHTRQCHCLKPLCFLLELQIDLNILSSYKITVLFQISLLTMKSSTRPSVAPKKLHQV